MQDNWQQPLLGWYVAEGYMNATVDSVSASSVYIDRGCQFSFSELKLKYRGAVRISYSRGDLGTYTEHKFLRFIEEEMKKLEDQGFAFVSYTIERFNPDYTNCNVQAGLRIHTGEKVYSSQIYFSGAQLNSQSYLQKISGYQDSMLITPDYLRFLREKLNASELFNTVSFPHIYLKEEEPVIIVEVEERSLNKFDGLLGYAPDASGEGQVVGDVELSLWNVLQQGNGVEFQYQRLKPETSQLSMEINQHWIGDLPVGLSAGFQLYQNDTTYQAREFNVDAFYQLKTGFKLKGGIGVQSSTSGNNIPVVVEPDGRKQSGRFGFEFFSLDNYDVSRRGSRINLMFTISHKDLENDTLAAFTQRGLSLEMEYYIPLPPKSVIASTLNAFILDTDRVTINDLKRFGGANSLRGYAEDQFRAGKMVWGDVEYRFLADQSSYFFVFAGTGWYERPVLITESDDSFSTQQLLYSGGFGLSYKTRIGRLSFSYALSPDESIGNGKVHVGIRTRL